MSLWLQVEGDRLTGHVHYDLPGPGLVVEGELQQSQFTIREEGGGELVGRCDPATGSLRGSYRLKGKEQAFSLVARPKSWPPLHLVKRRVQGGAGDTLCSVSDSSLRLFAIPAGPRTRINRRLADGAFREAEPMVRRCTQPVLRGSQGEVYFAGEGVLTVVEQLSAYIQGFGVLRTWSSGSSFDLATGQRVALTDVVSDVKVLRRLLTTCIHDYEQALHARERIQAVEPRRIIGCDDPSGPNYLWGCDGTSSPKWALVEGGIAILGSGFSKLAVDREAMGPVVSWAALLREGALVAEAPVAHLWGSVTTADADEPACSTGWGRERLIRWQELERQESPPTSDR